MIDDIQIESDEKEPQGPPNVGEVGNGLWSDADGVWHASWSDPSITEASFAYTDAVSIHVVANSRRVVLRRFRCAIGAAHASLLEGLAKVSKNFVDLSDADIQRTSVSEANPTP